MLFFNESLTQQDIVEEVTGDAWIQCTLPCVVSSKHWKSESRPNRNSTPSANAATAAAASVTATTTTTTTTTATTQQSETPQGEQRRNAKDEGDKEEEEEEEEGTEGGFDEKERKALKKISKKKEKVFEGMPDEVAKVTSRKQKERTMDQRCHLVLKLNSLYVFERANDSVCKGAFLLDDCEVTVLHVKRSRCNKRNILCVSHPFRTLLNGSKEVYLWFLTSVEVEKWYEALMFGTHILDSARAVQTQRNMFQSVVARCREIGQRNDALAALNAFIHRAWYSYYENPDVLKFLSDKIDVKLAQMKKPSVVSVMRMTRFSIGPNVPYLLSLKLTELGPLGELTMDSEISYAGGLSVEIECIVTIQIPITHKQITVPLAVSARLGNFVGAARIKILPPPATRVWLGLHQEPKYDMTFDTTLKTHTSVSIMSVIPSIGTMVEQLIRKEITEMYVLPNMDSVPLPKLTKVHKAQERFFNLEREERLRKQKEELDRLEARNGAAPAAAGTTTSTASTTATPAPPSGTSSPLPPAVPSRTHKPVSQSVAQPPPSTEMTSIRKTSEARAHTPVMTATGQTHAHNSKSASYQVLPSTLYLPDDEEAYGFADGHRAVSLSPIVQPTPTYASFSKPDTPTEESTSKGFSRWGRKRSNSQSSPTVTELADVSPRVDDEPPALPKRRAPPPPPPAGPKPPIPSRLGTDSLRVSKGVSASPSPLLPTPPVPQKEPVQLFPSEDAPEMHISPRFEQDAMAIPDPQAPVEPIETPPCYKKTTENPLEEQESEEDKKKTSEEEPKPVETADKEPVALPVYEAPPTKTEAEQTCQKQEEEKKEVFEFEDGIMVPEDKDDDDDCGDAGGEEVVFSGGEDKEERNNEESKEFEETQEDEPTEAGKEELVKKEEKEEEEEEGAEEMTTFETEKTEEVSTETQELPVTTAVTTTATSAADVPPPRPPKPTDMQRRSLEIFPDEDEPKPDPFDVLALPQKDPLIDELFGADGNPSDSELSQSPTHFETLHHRQPPPRPDGVGATAGPLSQSQPAQSQAQHSIFLRRPNEAHHSPSQFRASLSEKADRLKKWLK